MLQVEARPFILTTRATRATSPCGARSYEPDLKRRIAMIWFHLAGPRWLTPFSLNGMRRNPVQEQGWVCFQVLNSFAIADTLVTGWGVFFFLTWKTYIHHRMGWLLRSVVHDILRLFWTFCHRGGVGNSSKGFWGLILQHGNRPVSSRASLVRRTKGQRSLSKYNCRKRISVSLVSIRVTVCCGAGEAGRSQAAAVLRLCLPCAANLFHVCTKRMFLVNWCGLLLQWLSEIKNFVLLGLQFSVLICIDWL